MRLLRLVVMALVAGCTEFPDLGDRIDAEAQRAAYPNLTPLDPVIARAKAPRSTDDTVTEAVSNRAAQLAARAAALRGPVVDQDTRADMRSGVDTTALQ